MIKAVLASTGYEAAAVALGEHAVERRLKRARTEVLAVDVLGLRRSGAAQPDETVAASGSPWDKGRIVQDLTAESGIPRRRPEWSPPRWKSGSSAWA